MSTEQMYGTQVGVIVGDITKRSHDAIVNAANRSLLGGGGVDGAIHRAAGPKLLLECSQLRQTTAFALGLGTGEVVVTKGYDLLAPFVIHTVGPIWGPMRSVAEMCEELRNCYINCLKKAVFMRLKSICFPSISTGAYGFPKKLAAIQVRKVLKTFKIPDDMKVAFIFATQQDANIFYEEIMK